MVQTVISQIRVKSDQVQAICEKLKSVWRLIAPVEKPGKGRFSDATLLDYDEVNSLSDIIFDRHTFFSAKSTVFPIRETLFKIQNGELDEAKADIKPTIIFLRACDIHAMQVIDLHFLKDASLRDKYYERRRKSVKFVLIECCESFENCYCVSMGTNKSDDYSAFVRKTQNGYEIIVKDQDLKEFFPQGMDAIEWPQSVEKNERSITIPENIPNSVFADELWKEYSRRCIACGRCNTSCPTCTCFTVQDVRVENSSDSERKRVWSSCHVDKFSLLAGGHDFRKDYADRMRYRTMHKISDFKRRHGRQMCIGCGRCDEVCPEYISMFKCIDKINQVTEEGKYGR